MPAIRFLYQQKAANSHISDQADRRRAPETLSDWQEAAEFHVERPRMMIHGQLMSLFAKETKMLWNPAPPKFACSPSFIRDKLFPEYQVTHNDLTNEELHGDLQEGHELACGTEQHVPLISVKRPLSAPLPSFGPKVELKVPADFRAMTQELEEAQQRRSALVHAEENLPAPSLAGQQGVLTCYTNSRGRRGGGGGGRGSLPGQWASLRNLSPPNWHMSSWLDHSPGEPCITTITTAS
ncbi:hypothetical protein AAFF_G00090520 [Aldrovandia affinis]|uniref:Uncharacterized protein n=1 Tax=Aldrovandia affinis TaxID=143900 RepID=A0AAD7WBX3_9TELE|nr:hypothetical protein AAFF_G00090520 [Aldrovandia affinis]